MKLSLKQKALLITLGIMGSIVLGSLAISFIIVNVSFQTIVNALAVGFISFFIWVFYGIVLNRLEYQEKLKEMTEKKV